MGSLRVILCLLLAPLQAYISPTSQPSHRSVSILPELAALPRAASPVPSSPSHLPIPLSFPVQATSAETHPIRSANSFPAAGLSAVYLQELLIPEALGPEAIRGRARSISVLLWQQPRLPATCTDAPWQTPLSSSRNYPGAPREQT